MKEVLVLGLGNILWADEGFGVRAVEAFHAAYRDRTWTSWTAALWGRT